MVSATAAEDVMYEISSVEPQSLTSAFSIDPSNGIPKTRLLYCVQLWIWPISGSITCLPFEDAVPSAETILVTVTAASEDTDGEGASVAIFTVTDLPERPYFLEASYLRNLTLEHEAITGM